MPPTRPRRIVRRAVMAIAVVVLLVVGYVASYVTFQFAWTAGYTPTFMARPSFLHAINLAYHPLRWYAYESELPGATLLRSLKEDAESRGRSLR